jgi:hypothetical protein
MCVEFGLLYPFCLALRLVFGPGLRNRGHLRGEGVTPPQASSLEGQVSLVVRHLAANYQRRGCRPSLPMSSLVRGSSLARLRLRPDGEMPSTERWLYVQYYLDYRKISYQIWNFPCHCHSSLRWWDFQEYSPPHICTPTNSWSSESSHMPRATNILDSLS